MNSFSAIHSCESGVSRKLRLTRDGAVLAIAALMLGCSPEQESALPNGTAAACLVPEGNFAAYKPTQRLPGEYQIVAMYVGSQTCGPCRLPEFKAAIRRMNIQLSCLAAQQGSSFSAVGVALDWDTDSAVTFLASAGPFDEIDAGANWANAVSLKHLMSPDGTAAIPQVVVLGRTLDPDAIGVLLESERELAKFVGSDQIMDWVKRGTPMEW